MKSYGLDEDKNVVGLEGDVFFHRTPENSTVGKTKVGDLEVSTVFLSIDHNFAGEGPPLVFETMVFNAEGRGEYCDRYSTWKEAGEGHERVVQALREGKRPL